MAQGRECVNCIEFVVPGRPMPAVRMTSRGKWVKERAQKYLNYKEQVGWAARQAYCGLIRGPVRVEVQVFLKGQRAGDVDNYAKSILDGCNEVIWLDDQQVIELHVYRHTGRPERVEVRVTEIAERGASADD